MAVLTLLKWNTLNINSEALTQIQFFKHYHLHQDSMNKKQRHNTKNPPLKLLLLEIYEYTGKFYLFHNYEDTEGATIHNRIIYTNT